MIDCYLDTAQWNKLANRQLDRDLFMALVRKWKIRPVLSFIHALELAMR